MEANVRQEQDVTVVTLSGELDASNNQELSEVLDRELGEGRRRFIVDLEGVGFVDSSGIAALVRFYKSVQAGSGEMCLAQPQPPVRRIFELTRLNQVFDIYSDFGEATRHFEAG